ncbi:MAG: adenosine deaminase, partial [Acaryochloridaceae cyanobacterium RL_2_7]|nr:adenosine deaminase [Acaryochloridaceae cyanobacterium RL_2_7]
NVVFDSVFWRRGSDIAICTDNAGLHNVRLPFEYENLLTHNIINFDQLKICQHNAFRHAFAWPFNQEPSSILGNMVQQKTPTLDPVG